MIDIHSHILPAIDDGARNMDMTLSMLHMSVESGVTDIIATPHVNRGGHVPSWQEIEENGPGDRCCERSASAHPYL